MKHLQRKKSMEAPFLSYPRYILLTPCSSKSIPSSQILKHWRFVKQRLWPFPPLVTKSLSLSHFLSQNLPPPRFVHNKQTREKSIDQCWGINALHSNKSIASSFRCVACFHQRTFALSRTKGRGSKEESSWLCSKLMVVEFLCNTIVIKVPDIGWKCTSLHRSLPWLANDLF